MAQAVNAQDDHRSFIVNHTRLLAPPLVPEIRLYLAEESLPLWEKTEEQLGQMNVPPPFWAFAWAGGQALARYILDEPQLVKRRAVIDLGAGSGICGLAAKHAGAADVLCADVDPFSVHAVALNADANGLVVTATKSNLLDMAPPDVDVLLIGDLFYEKSLSECVMDWAWRAHRNGAVVLAGDPKRSFFPEDRFEVSAHYSVPVTRALEDADIKNTAVWKMRAAG